MIDQPFLGSNISLVKIHNLKAILLSLLYDQQISRVELAHKTNLSNTTITNLIDDLISQDIVGEYGIEIPNGPRQVGRPRTILKLIPGARYAVGLHIGIGIFRIAITNLRAEILYNEMYNFNRSLPAEEVIDFMAEKINLLIDSNHIAREKIIGIGVGASGLIDHTTGIVRLAHNLGWHNVPLQKLFVERLKLPVVIENNVRAMALGEVFFGAGKNVQTLVFVYGRVGVGAGIVINGRIFRGGKEGAGEIGHIIIQPEGTLCRCGKKGCLETVISESYLIEKTQNSALEHPNSLLAQYYRDPSNSSTIDRLFRAARDGDPHAIEIIQTSAYYLGLTLASLVNILDPDLILLGGLFAQGQDLYLPTAEKIMREVSFGGLGEQVQLQATSFGWRAGVIGAAALALTELFYLPNEEI